MDIYHKNEINMQKANQNVLCEFMIRDLIFNHSIFWFSFYHPQSLWDLFWIRTYFDDTFIIFQNDQPIAIWASLWDHLR